MLTLLLSVRNKYGGSTSWDVLSISEEALLLLKRWNAFLKESLQIEECEEEEIIIDSDGEDDNGAACVDRSVTPTPIQDFAANTVYTEGQYN